MQGRAYSSLKDSCNVPVYSVMIQNGIIRTCTLKLNTRKRNLKPGIMEKELLEWLNFITPTHPIYINTSHIQSQLGSHRGCTDLTVHAVDKDQECEDHPLILQLYSKNDSLCTQVSELRHIAPHIVAQLICVQQHLLQVLYNSSTS